MLVFSPPLACLLEAPANHHAPNVCLGLLLRTRHGCAPSEPLMIRPLGPRRFAIESQDVPSAIATYHGRRVLKTADEAST